MTTPIFQYQERLKNLFKERNQVWDYFAKPKEDKKKQETILQDILKNTYRFSSETDNELYQLTNECIEHLELANLEVKLYQNQNSKQDNAEIFYMNDTAHVLFSGDILSILNEKEKKALIGHELTHIELYKRDDGGYFVSSQIMNAIANDASSPIAYFETARKSNLFTEFYCDTGAMKCTDAETVISMLIKIHTGLKNVSAQDYIKQVNEILDKKATTTGTTHPELYYRVKWLDLVEQQEEQRQQIIEQLVFGQPKIEEVDLFLQEELTELSEDLITWMLQPKWMRGEVTMNMAKRYFPDFVLKKIDISSSFIERIQQFSSSIKNYFAYILMDFILSDAEIQEPALANAMQIAEQTNMEKELEEAIKKELKLNAREFKHQMARAQDTLSHLAESSIQAIQE